MSTRIATIFLAVAALYATPAALRAQDDQAQEQQQGPPAETELVFEREVFVYPLFTRSNPFVALTSDTGVGPLYAQLRLSGIIFSENDPSLSVAVFNTAGVTVGEDGTLAADGEGESFYVKTGQTLGNITVVEITRETVVVDVEEFGLADRKVMQPLNLLGGNQ